jgi:phytanoyl-CoA hydroxylase
MIKKLLRHVWDKRFWGKGSLSLEKMWFLQDDGARLAASSLDPLVKNHLEEIRTNGVAILKGNVPAALCDEVIHDFRNYCIGSPESKDFKDEHSLYERLACLHLVSDAARRVAFSPTVAKITEAAFGKPAVVVGSLFFDKGSAQSIHRDTPAFFTNPLNHFFGVWTALEDVLPGSGPLFYFLKGHTVAPDDELFGNPSVNSKNYFEIVKNGCRHRNLDLIEYYPKKGDTLIWHPALPHGGAPILKPDLSRRSIVFHYIPEGVPIHGADTFFGVRSRIGNKATYRTIAFGDRKVIDQGRPRFFHNRDEGNFDEF